MAKTLANLLTEVRAEWAHWGRSSWNLVTGHKAIGHTDDEDEFARYVLDHYNKVGGGSPSINDIQNDLYPWSAVGMSAVFHQAGFEKSEFPFAQAHSKWIRAFIAARNAGHPALYHGFRLSEPEATPEVGDLVGYSRIEGQTFEKAQSVFDRTGNYPSHTDLVVERRPGEVDVIGFNVRDSVTLKTLPLTATGHMADRVHNWFVVLRRRGF